MNLNQMNTLVKIAEAGSLSGAARLLNKSVPAVSVAMKKLEAELDLELFSRDQYRISLTPVGEALCDKARGVLQRSEELNSLSQRLAHGQEAEIKIGVLSSLASRFIFDPLRRCESDFPQTMISLRMGAAFRPMEQLLTEKVDLATVMWLNVEDELESLPFLKPSLVTVATPGFLPYEEGEEITLRELRNYRQVILRGSMESESLSHTVRGRGRAAACWEVDDDNAKFQIIIAGMGWARLPAHMIRRQLEDGSLVRLNIRDYPQETEVEVRIARLADKPVGPVAERLWQYFEEASPLLNGGEPHPAVD